MLVPFRGKGIGALMYKVARRLTSDVAVTLPRISLTWDVHKRRMFNERDPKSTSVLSVGCSTRTAFQHPVPDLVDFRVDRRGSVINGG